MCRYSSCADACLRTASQRFPPVTTQWGTHAAWNDLVSAAAEGPTLVLGARILAASQVARMKYFTRLRFESAGEK